MESRFQCSDCARIFTSRRNRTIHAFGAGHMNDHTCVDCHTVFDTQKALKRHQNLHKKPHPENSMAGFNTDNLPGKLGWCSYEEISELIPLPVHFSTEYWLESKDLKAALQKRPNHGYQWASPALSNDIYRLLESELLDSRRRELEYFPSVLEARPSANKQQNASASNRPLPSASPQNDKTCNALVIDCEMVGLEDGSSDLVRLSVVDFLTGNIVIDNLVQPIGRVKDWRSRVSGVDHAILQAAKKDPKTTVLQGWPEARQKLFDIADANTILLGHALPNDLKILRIAADRVVDSQIITAQAVFGKSNAKFLRSWGLKSGCKELMSIAIQQPRVAHDPLEDALATRELIIWCLTHPKELLEWGTKAKIEHEKSDLAMREKQRAEALKKAEEKKKLEDAAAKVGETSGMAMQEW
ncbi:ribonuclease H-like domain-containing protein [Nemania sp. FL0031]|nr:ribonuclease H-like domain-containing protein [Nemania sp. FL0031]